MLRTFVLDGDLYGTADVLDIKGDISDHMHYALEDGIYITEDFGDGRVRLEKLTTIDDKDDWQDLGVYWEEVEEA